MASLNTMPTEAICSIIIANLLMKGQAFMLTAFIRQRTYFLEKKKKKETRKETNYEMKTSG